MINRETEVVVIGGGVMGAASAYYLARARKSVLLIEKGGIASGSSGANAALTLVSNRTPGPFLEMGLAGLREYDHLGQELKCDIEFERCGALYLIETPNKYEELKSWVESQNKAGLTEMKLIDKNELLRLEPNLEPSLVGAVFNPWDGHINPHYLVHGFAAKAKESGAEVITHTKVVAIKISHNAVNSVVTNKGEEIKTRYIVNACGIHTPVVGKMAGLEVPIIPNKEQTLVSQKASRIINTPLLTNTKESIVPGAENGNVAFYCNYTKEGNLLLGGLNQFVGEDDRMTFYAFQSICKNATKYLPILKEINIIRSFSKYYVYTPDDKPILGSVDDLHGFIIASGHNYYGIALGAITGKLISELICFGETSIPIQEFSLNRFK